MRAALTLLLVLHGTIHVLGFIKWSRLGHVPQLSGRTLLPLFKSAERLFAIGWVAALLALLGSAAFRSVRHEAWWMLALCGLVLSQCLIILAWKDAKFGSIANLLILMPSVSAAAYAALGRKVDSEVRELYARAPASLGRVQARELGQLPAPVRKWLEASGVVGRERAQSVRLKQVGELRTGPEAAWMPARAEQYFSVEPPAFIWRVDADMLHLLPIAGRDKYVEGRGNMLIQALSLVTLVDASDQKIAHGSLLRFLGETVWFPSAALSSRMVWSPIDATRARATMRDEALTVSAVFTFDERGRVLGMRAERYLGGGADAKLTPWLVSCSEWRTFDGVQVPSRGDVGWAPPSGYFSYYRWEIVDVEYNRPALYEPREVNEDAELPQRSRSAARASQTVAARDLDALTGDPARSRR